MEFLFSFLAGLLTSVNPCVLPLLPIIIVNIMNNNKYGPIYMCIGLSITYIITSYIMAQLLKYVVVDPRVVQHISSIFIIIFGIMMVIPALAKYLSLSLSGLANFTNNMSKKLPLDRPLNFVILGGLLGIIWSPCSGPILGEALFILTVANFDSEVFKITAGVLFPFIMGASLPILLVAYSGKYLMGKYFHGILQRTWLINFAMGIILIIYGLLIMFGYLKYVEAFLIDLLPFEWLSFTVQF